MGQVIGQPRAEDRARWLQVVLHVIPQIFKIKYSLIVQFQLKMGRE